MSSITDFFPQDSYQSLVSYGVELLKRPNSIGSEAEAELKRVALGKLPPDLADRDDHADDLALQAISDAAARVGRADEMESPDW